MGTHLWSIVAKKMCYLFSEAVSLKAQIKIDMFIFRKEMICSENLFG